MNKREDNLPAARDQTNAPIAAMGENIDDIAFVAMFLATKKRRSENTAKVYEGTLKEFFTYLNNKPLQQITYSNLVGYSEWLSSPDPYRNPVILKISTQNRKISTIKSMFKYGMKIGYFLYNPAEPIETQRVDSNVEQRILTVDELENMFIIAQKRGLFSTVIMCFFAATGCRVSELTGLMWKEIYIDPSGYRCFRVKGKGSKHRNLKMVNTLWDVIVAYREEQGLKTELDPKYPGTMLINSRGRPCSAATVWKEVQSIAQEAGINKDVSPHFLRHTFATEVAKDKDSNIWRLQHDLGHASPSTTELYVHIAQGMEETSIDHLGYMERIKAALKNKKNEEGSSRNDYNQD